jgi:hypothetical protein
MSSAVLVQTNGWQRSFQLSMNRSMAATRSLTLVKAPRRMHLLQAGAGQGGEFGGAAHGRVAQALLQVVPYALGRVEFGRAGRQVVDRQPRGASTTGCGCEAFTYFYWPGVRL